MAERVQLTPTRVKHVVSGQQGYAVEFNNNDNAPGYWVIWDGEQTGHNWFAVDQLVKEGGRDG
jgi:hypothetical protein